MRAETRRKGGQKNGAGPDIDKTRRVRPACGICRIIPGKGTVVLPADRPIVFRLDKSSAEHALTLLVDANCINRAEFRRVRQIVASHASVAFRSQLVLHHLEIRSSQSGFDLISS